MTTKSIRTKAPRKTEYGSSNIKNLQFPENVRSKPTLYIGPIDSRGIFSILREVMDNVVDEALQARANACYVYLDRTDGSYSVADDGAGIPVGNIKVTDPISQKTHKVSALKAAVGLLNTSGKFDDKAYAISRGTHGIGQKATNALSTKFSVHTHRDGSWWHTSYAKGKIVKDVAKTKAPINPCTGKRMVRGTLVTFTPDTSIFTESAFPLSMLNEWATIAAFFTPQFKVHLATSEGKSKTYYFPNGPKDYLESRIEKNNAEPLSPKIFNASNALVDCVVQFTQMSGTDFSAFTNGLRNVEGGVHLSAFYSALKDSLTPFAKKDQNFTIHDIREGVIGLVNVKLSHPQFDSQTKEKLVDERASEPVQSYLKKELSEFFAKNKSLAQSICEQANAVRSLKDKFKLSREAIRKIKKISKQGFPVKATVVPKIAPELRSLFLVEGGSADGCFHGNTRVMLADGTLETLESLYYRGSSWEGLFWNAETQTLDIGTMSRPFITKWTDDLVIVTLCNKQKITCTPDHLFMITDGVYVEAQNLLGYYIKSVSDPLKLESSDRTLFAHSVERYTGPRTPVYDVTNRTIALNHKGVFADKDSSSNFVAEGVVVHNSAKKARFQNDEVLPLKGKILNSQRSADSRVFASEEVLNIMAMIGYDPDHKDPMSALRVGKVILLADPDPDGPLKGDTLIPAILHGENKEGRYPIEFLSEQGRPVNVRVWNGQSFEWHEVEPPRVEKITDHWLEITMDLQLWDDETQQINVTRTVKIECTANHYWSMWKMDPDPRAKIRLNNGLYCVRAEELVEGDVLARYDPKSNFMEKAVVTNVAHVYGEEDTEFYCFHVPGFHCFTVDGGIVSKNCHINSLILTLFAKYLPEMFERNMIYLALTKPFYAYDEAKDHLYTGDTALEVETQLKEAKLFGRLRPAHLKGWGECPPPLLRRLAFDPTTRILAEIQPAHTKQEHAEFEMIMGESAAARRRLLGIDTRSDDPAKLAVKRKVKERPVRTKTTARKTRRAK